MDSLTAVMVGGMIVSVLLAIISGARGKTEVAAAVWFGLFLFFLGGLYAADTRHHAAQGLAVYGGRSGSVFVAATNPTEAKSYYMRGFGGGGLIMFGAVVFIIWKVVTALRERKTL